MILPIYTYGQAVLREETAPVSENTPALQQLIDDMFETMRGASGIGLAAPQVGQALRLFVVDLRPMADDLRDEHGGTLPAYAEAPMVFINPDIEDLDDVEDEEMEEGCLSIPDLRQFVVRPCAVRIRFLDRHFQPQELVATGILARVLQHENDHLHGVLFIDHLSTLKKRLLRRRLRDMADGQVDADYPLAVPVA